MKINYQLKLLTVSAVIALFVSLIAYTQTSHSNAAESTNSIKEKVTPAKPSAKNLSTHPEDSEMLLEEHKSSEMASKEVVESLESALDLIDKNKQALKQKEALLKQADSTATKEQLNIERNNIQQSLQANMQNFIQLATGGLMHFQEGSRYQQEQFDWQSEFSEILRPLMSEIKALTASQREREQVRIELTFYKQQLRNLNAAIKKIDAYKQLAKTIDSSAVQQLEKLSTEIASQLSETESQIDVLGIKYRELQNKSEDEGWIQKVKSIAGGILLHLLIALAGAVFAYYLFGLLVVLLNRVNTDNHPKMLFAIRAIQFFLRIISLFIAIGTYCAILVAFSEWALMSISVIVLFGLVLSLKDVLPQYFTEMRTILNLGSVREGERVMYNGLPWRINHLDFYTEIYNRDLAATLRLPISEVADLRSRAPVKSELWFPTRQGDYVLFADGGFAQVVRQSPDSVLLDYFGSLLSYQTLDFLAAKPYNLSRQKFSVFSTFGVDYKYQAEVTTQMLAQLREFIEAALAKQEYAEHVLSVAVEFSLADTSSLNFRVALTCKGSAAKYYPKIKRWIQSACVDCSNKYGWEIPFQQLTVHAADS